MPGRRHGRLRYVLGGVGLVLAGASLTAGPPLLAELWEDPRPAEAAPEDDEPVVSAGPQQRLLLVTAPDPEGPATSVTLLAGPSGEVPASALFLPAGTLVHTPGLGLDRLGNAHRYGGAELVRATVENALSVQIGAVATVTETAFAEFLDRAGDVEVDLPERVVERAEDGSATVRFERGPQIMGGAELAALWLHRSSGDDELEALRRRRQVLEVVLAAAADPVVRDRLVADGAPQLRTDAEAAWLQELFGELATAQTDERVRYNLLPVERFGTAGSDGERAYRIHAEDTARLVRSLLGGAEDVGEGSAVRVQVLNGVGTPGVGQLVDRLLGEDVRLVLTGNANTFEYAETRILVYEESHEALEAARRVQERLGVGTIQVSRQPQSIVDLTIVVGADLVAAASSEEPPDGSESAD